MLDNYSKEIRHCIFCSKAVDISRVDTKKPRLVRVEVHYNDVYNDPGKTSKLKTSTDDAYICYECAQASVEHWSCGESEYSPCHKERENLIYKVKAELFMSDVYAQLAEECSELAQAALKAHRFYRGMNPPAVCADKLRDNLTEEISDVQLCLDILGKLPDRDVMDAKLKRWADRLEKENLNPSDAVYPSNVDEGDAAW